MKNPVVSGAAICDYIPQRAPIVMIDKFFGIEGDTSSCGLTIQPDCMLVENGHLTDGGIIEHIAQSGAMHIGYESVNNGHGVPLGVIGNVSKPTINALPQVGDELYTTIKFEAVVGPVSLIAAEVRVGDEVIATGKMKVATQPQ